MFGEFPESASERARVGAVERRALVRYTLLTLALFAPLLWAFVSVRSLYPFAASTMMEGGDPQQGKTFYVLRGETVGGETIDLPPVKLTDALSGRAWSLVAATVENRSFKIPSPHPDNVALIVAAGGVEKLQRAARLADLMRAWGSIYNARLPMSSAHRLRAVRLDEYRWEGPGYIDYARPLESWRTEL